MSSPDLSRVQRNALVALVTKRTDDGVDTWAAPPRQAIAGAIVYDSRQCALCHTLNGSGSLRAPVLNGVAARRTREWVEGHFGDPQAFVPASPMPPYKFEPKDLDAITDYLMAVPK
jgi:mono/diheme cytochrome c family protein